MDPNINMIVKKQFRQNLSKEINKIIKFVKMRLKKN